ncbi:hypothetical protein ZIOFF_051088 [Zingiber officinale]|uniref:Uncharacterized protein n=1 Tax=Zingiber officinale TaxID=94328 RepID=A0A8J5FLG1_ZINOF|nr:hypothetical protein ZIOFF_051088 [Zingiber officinale]
MSDLASAYHTRISVLSSQSSLQIRPDPCVRITSNAVRHVAVCCTGLKRLHLSGIQDVNGEAVDTLARHCPRLSEIAFLDCGKVNEAALVNVLSLRFLSIDGSPALCALNCSAVDEEGRRNPSTFINTKGKLLLTRLTDALRGIASLFKQPIMNQQTLFVQWRNFKKKDKNLNDIMIWLEWILSHSLLRVAESNPHGMDDFWLRQGASMLLRFAKSSQEDVQERAATGLVSSPRMYCEHPVIKTFSSLRDPKLILTSSQASIQGRDYEITSQSI